MKPLVTGIALLALAVAPVASATVVAQWDFNRPVSTGGVIAASSGTGGFTHFGRPTSFLIIPFASAPSNGTPTDPGDPTLSATTRNKSVGANHGASLTAVPPVPSGSRGVQATTSTVGFYGINVSFHLSAGFRTSRYYQLTFTSDGINYAPPSAGTGSTATNLGTFNAGTAFSSASVSNTGLIDIRANDGLITSTATQITNGFIWNLSYSLPFGSPFENNPTFGFRIAPVIDPNGTDYVSSFAGTTSADTVKGYLPGSGSLGGGSTNYDLVTVTGVPEPTAALTLPGVAALALRRTRRRA